MVAVFVFSEQFSYSQKMWYNKSDFSGGARSGSVSFVIDGNAYIGLGNNETDYFKDFWKYDQALDTWTKIADFPGEARSRSIAFTLNGKAYVGLGYKYGSPTIIYKDFYKYDPSDNSWTKIDDFPGGERYGAVAFTIGESAFAGTGLNAGNYLKDFWKFTGGSWTRIADLSDGPRAFATGFSYNTKGYIGGGVFISGATEIKNSMYAYNTLTGYWEEAVFAHANLGVQNASTYVLNDTAWIMYGSLKQVIAFDPKNNTIKQFDDKLGLGKARNSGVTFVLNGKPYFGLGDYFEFPSSTYSKDILTFGLFNYPPTGLSISESVIKDKSPANTVVGTLSTQDQTLNDEFTYSLVPGDGINDADNGLFTISGNVLKTLAIIDFSVKQEFRINVKTTDKEGAAFIKPFSISRMYFEYISESGLPVSDFNECQWIDYDNDGYLDIIYAHPFKLFKNNGDGTFTDVSANLKGVLDGDEVACHDLNNDGFIDIIGLDMAESKIFINNCDGTFTGYDNTGLAPAIFDYIACADYNKDGFTDILLNNRFFQNNGNHTFTEIIINGLPPACNSAGSWGDYNNDGWPDFVVMGAIYNPFSEYFRLYKNNGDGTFSLQPQSFENISWGSVDWGDYNNDGYLDLLTCGSYRMFVYKNNGNGSFTQTVQNLTGLSGGKASWGDFNNDGYLDIISAGYSVNNNISQIYINNKTGGFDHLPAKLPPSDYCIEGDFNNDGKLDFLITGQETSNGKSITRLYKNITASLPNTSPSSPGNLVSTINNETASLSWNKANDAETGQNGLSYNIRIGVSPGGNQVVPSLSDPVSGKPLMIIKGNCGPNTSFYMKLPKGTYYWSVQSIDGAFAASEWAPEKKFTISSSAIKSKQAISFKGSLNFVYGTDSIKLKAYATSGLPVTFSIAQNDIVSLKNDSLFFKNPGTIPIDAKQAGNASYEPVSITKKIVYDKKILKYWCENTTFEYGADPVVKFIYDGFVRDENESVLDTPPMYYTNVGSWTLPGSYPVFLVSGTDNNYAVTWSGGCTIEIIKRNIKVVPLNAEITYGNNPGPVIVSYKGFTSGQNENTLETKPVFETFTSARSIPGSYPYKLVNNPVSSRFNLVYPDSTVLTIKKRNLDITPENAEKELNEPNPQIRLKFLGFVNQHTADSLQVLPSIVHSVNEETPVGTYPISLTGGSDNRYEYIFHEGTLTVKNKVGLSENTYENVKVYPVPFTDKLFIELPDDGPVTIEIINSQGRTIYKERHGNKLIEINSSKYQKGIYFIKIKDTVGVNKTKVIK